MKRSLIIGSIILVIGALGVGGFLWVRSRASAPTNTVPSGNSNPASQPTTSGTTTPTEGESIAQAPAAPGTVDDRDVYQDGDIIYLGTDDEGSPDYVKPVVYQSATPAVNASDAGQVSIPSDQVGVGQAPSLNGSDDDDNDGLTNDQEFQQSTNPQSADTDGDGLSDGVEVRTTRTDPKKADTDGDGLTDGDEVRHWKSDPLNPDTDHDGYSDGTEVKGGYNPNGPGKL
jgi:hypothetical protein